MADYEIPEIYTKTDYRKSELDKVAGLLQEPNYEAAKKTLSADDLNLLLKTRFLSDQDEYESWMSAIDVLIPNWIQKMTLYEMRSIDPVNTITIEKIKHILRWISKYWIDTNSIYFQKEVESLNHIIADFAQELYTMIQQLPTLTESLVANLMYEHLYRGGFEFLRHISTVLAGKSKGRPNPNSTKERKAEPKKRKVIDVEEDNSDDDVIPLGDVDMDEHPVNDEEEPLPPIFDTESVKKKTRGRPKKKKQPSQTKTNEAPAFEFEQPTEEEINVEPAKQPKRKSARNKKKDPIFTRPTTIKEDMPQDIPVFENSYDYLLAWPEIELQHSAAVPVGGVDKAIKRVDNVDPEIWTATDFKYGQRVFGRKIIPKMEALRQKKKQLEADDVIKLGSFGVYEVNQSGIGVFRRESERYGVSYKGEKRWLNLTKMIRAYQKGQPICKLRRGYPGIGPTGCNYYTDYVGNHIMSNGDHGYNVQVPEDDDSVARKGYLKFGDKKIETNILLDTGALRTEINGPTAKKLGLYSSRSKKDGGTVSTGGGDYDVWSIDGVTIGFKVKDIQPLTDIVVPDKLNIEKEFKVIFPKDETLENNFDVILGRTTMRSLGFRVYIQ